jgi:hypothetical protein
MVEPTSTYFAAASSRPSDPHSVTGSRNVCQNHIRRPPAATFTWPLTVVHFPAYTLIGAVFPGSSGRVKGRAERGRLSHAAGALEAVGATRMIERPGVGQYDIGNVNALSVAVSWVERPWSRSPPATSRRRLTGWLPAGQRPQHVRASRSYRICRIACVGSWSWPISIRG